MNKERAKKAALEFASSEIEKGNTVSMVKNLCDRNRPYYEVRMGIGPIRVEKFHFDDLKKGDVCLITDVAGDTSIEMFSGYYSDGSPKFVTWDRFVGREGSGGPRENYTKIGHYDIKTKTFTSLKTDE